MANPPLISPVFQLSGTVLQYKPHVDAPTWTNLIDLSPFSPVAQVYPDSVVILPDMLKTLSGGFTAPTIQASQQIGQFTLMRGLNAEVECKVLLGAGSYVASLAYIKANTGGQIRIQINGANIWNTLETYNSTTQLGQYISANLPSALSGGLHTINIKIPSKNASSSNYDLLMSYLVIKRQ